MWGIFKVGCLLLVFCLHTFYISLTTHPLSMPQSGQWMHLATVTPYCKCMKISGKMEISVWWGEICFPGDEINLLNECQSELYFSQIFYSDFNKNFELLTKMTNWFLFIFRMSFYQPLYICIEFEFCVQCILDLQTQFVCKGWL